MDTDQIENAQSRSVFHRVREWEYPLPPMPERWWLALLLALFAGSITLGVGYAGQLGLEETPRDYSGREVFMDLIWFGPFMSLGLMLTWWIRWKFVPQINANTDHLVNNERERDELSHWLSIKHRFLPQLTVAVLLLALGEFTLLIADFPLDLVFARGAYFAIIPVAILSGAAIHWVFWLALYPWQLGMKRVQLDYISPGGTESLRSMWTDYQVGTGAAILAIGFVTGFIVWGNVWEGADRVALGVGAGAAIWLIVAYAFFAPRFFLRRIVARSKRERYDQLDLHIDRRAHDLTDDESVGHLKNLADIRVQIERSPNIGGDTVFVGTSAVSIAVAVAGIAVG